MSKEFQLAVITGSLRRDGLSRQIANAMIQCAPTTVKATVVEIGALPLYDQMLDANAPFAAWAVFRDEVRRADAVLFVTPEYNRSVPGALKNAIDVGSRPYGASVWSGKPAAVVSQSPGAMGGFGANHHLRQSLVFLDMPTMQQPEAYVGESAALFGSEGEIVSKATADFFASFMASFASWIEVHAPAAGIG